MQWTDTSPPKRAEFQMTWQQRMHKQNASHWHTRYTTFRRCPLLRQDKPRYHFEADQTEVQGVMKPMSSAKKANSTRFVCALWLTLKRTHGSTVRQTNTSSRIQC